MFITSFLIFLGHNLLCSFWNMKCFLRPSDQQVAASDRQRSLSGIPQWRHSDCGWWGFHQRCSELLWGEFYSKLAFSSLKFNMVMFQIGYHICKLHRYEYRNTQTSSPPGCTVQARCKFVFAAFFFSRMEIHYTKEGHVLEICIDLSKHEPSSCLFGIFLVNMTENPPLN